MSWILIEGVDRCGKSTIADHYKKLGYKVIHMGPPDKKYFKPGYNGESYLEEMVNLYQNLAGQKVVFDRTTFGELIWSQVYGRQQMLSEEDIDYLSNIERNNDVKRILMYDSNTDAHWQRCVDNKEPLTRQQFGRANIFYERLVRDYGFIKKQLSDFPGFGDIKSSSNDRGASSNILSSEEELYKNSGDTNTTQITSQTTTVGGECGVGLIPASHNTGSIEDKLERANAIRALLQGQIVKKKEGVYVDIDKGIREYLQGQLDQLFTPPKRHEEFLSNEEISILKLYVQRIKAAIK